MRNITPLYFLLIFSLAVMTGCSRPAANVHHSLPGHCDIYDMKQAACIDRDELVRRLRPYRVVFIGDQHDSQALHRSLAGLFDRLGRSGRHLLLANEWFTPGDDPVLGQYAGRTFEGNFTETVQWRRKAGYPFASYAPIYDAVRNAGGELYGINMDKMLQKEISDGNVTGMTPRQREFYDSLDMNLTAHRSIIIPSFDHCHGKKRAESSEECRQRMYRVQVAWDSYMAKQAAELAGKKLRGENDLLVVFAGAMHLAYGLGINARFARLSREPFVTILPVPEGESQADVGEADYLLFYPPKSREVGTQE